MGKSPVSFEERPAYLSYLLRLWQEDKEGQAWRMSLENAHTDERKGFASLDELFSFLRQRIKMSSQANSDHAQGREVDPIESNTCEDLP
jgi:hypothetical protein